MPSALYVRHFFVRLREVAPLMLLCFRCFSLEMQASLANHKQLVDHYGSKHPKEPPPSPPS